MKKSKLSILIKVTDTLNIASIQGDSTSAFLITDSVWSAANFSSDFVGWPSIFQENPNQNSFIIRKMFPLFQKIQIDSWLII